MARVVVVDDEPDLLWMVQKGLSLRGHEVIAYGGYHATAEHLAGDETADVYVVDLLLRDGAGDDLLTLIRERRPASATVVMTGDIRRLMPGHELTVSVDRLIMKPFRLSELVAVVESVILSRGQVHT